MLKNIVFDFGQVLVRFEPAYMVSRYVTDAEDAKLLEDVVFDRLYWDPLDAGTITDAEVIAACKARLPARLWEVAEKIYVNWIYNIPEIDGMDALLCELKEVCGAKLYLLSNICTYFADHAHEIPILRHLDGCVFSSTAGAVKPDRAIYEHLCQKFSLLPTETLFVDDRAINVDGARACGIDGYVFDGDAKKLRAYLEQKLNNA